ncbi:hypothetical protein [Flavisolibacter ginsengisoli]|jgi:hypothetical protein|uniref:Uncharacterized protein n=1 Tax=Flavisolibacter ginsengisoli DSM 18119 TaxID=1121884 RepID=A0A1M5EP12_9BACT|nr:hypothetical protein [Flavisolibacter ginsengisoli]SHF80841.1 hypothetical protein SAMN02745131_03577 [Flavisolibacter ginsengisoli DSM 18119]
MKNSNNSAWRCKQPAIALYKITRGLIQHPVQLSAILLLCLTMEACQKEGIKENTSTETVQAIQGKEGRSEVINYYSGLSWQTTMELQQARAATAKYRNIDNAIKDGYADIAVDVEHMGHHYMNTSLVDGTFDIRHPEILVYNRDANGKQVLVAVEYAVPLTDPMPEGFTGSQDVWNGTSGFPLWLLHAWVWAYNPDGVFNWTNEAVELH